MTSKGPQKKIRWLVFVSFALLGLYFFWTHFSAILFMRWVVEKSGIPFEVVDARWKVRPKYLLKGQIDQLFFKIKHTPSGWVFEVQTPVKQIWNGNETIIELKPEMRVTNLPNLSGNARIALGLKTANVFFDLFCNEGRTYKNPSFATNFKNCRLTGSVNSTNLLDRTKWLGTVIGEIGGLNVKRSGSAKALHAEKVKSTLLLFLREGFPFPLYANAKTQFKKVSFESESYQIHEDSLEANVQLKISEKQIELGHLSVDSPFQLKAQGSIDTQFNVGQFFYNLSLKLKDILDDRLVTWFAAEHRQLRRAKSNGLAVLSGTVSKTDGWRHRGSAFLHAKKLDLPNIDFFTKDAMLNVPIDFPSDDDTRWGKIEVKEIEFKSVLLKKLMLHLAVTEDGLEITTENDAQKDEPIRQQVWGGAINIANLYVFKPWQGLAEITSSVYGGPFELVAIQRDLCLAAKNPVPGQLFFEYPELKQQDHELVFRGATKLNLFGGTAEIGDILFSLAGAHPKVQFSLLWNDLDLAEIGKWTKIGDMRGGIEGHLKNTTLLFTSLGPLPLSYDLRIQGLRRGGNKIRLYGRAIDNILQLVGMERDDLPWYANIGISVSTLWRNWVPAQVDYMGFRAKTDREWTELSTFDPAGQKKHYLLYGKEFTIPLNSHGVYPVVMHTESFQSWLRGMAEYFRKTMKGAKQNESTESKTNDGSEHCTTLW